MTVAASLRRQVPAGPPMTIGLPSNAESWTWPEGAVWPLTPARLQSRFQLLVAGFFRFVGDLSDADDQRIAVLGGTALITRARELIELAELSASAAEFDSPPAEIEYFRGKHEVAVPGRANSAAIAVRRLGALRSARTTRHWTPLWQLPRAWLRPTSWVISQNPLLQSELRARRKPAWFMPADQILRAARETPPLEVDVTELSHRAAAALVDAAQQTASRALLLGLLREFAVGAFRRAAADLSGLRAQELPAHVASGTGGQYAARAVGLEVMRRGGIAERFEHGGPCGLIAFDAGMQITDLAATSRFVMMTEAKVSLVRAARSTDAIASFCSVDIAAGSGDPHFRAVPRSAPQHTGARPTVIYATTMFRGTRQYQNPLLSDPVYLDWQRRVLTALRQMPIRIVFKPHPGGRGRHPLESLAETSYHQLESLISDADVLVFDYLHTTAFWSSLCSNRRVVFLDLGISAINPAIEKEFTDRCRVVKATFGSDNRPVVNPDEFAAAVCTPGRADPSAFRAMLAGD